MVELVVDRVIFDGCDPKDLKLEARGGKIEISTLSPIYEFSVLVDDTVEYDMYQEIFEEEVNITKVAKIRLENIKTKLKVKMLEKKIKDQQVLIDNYKARFARKTKKVGK